MSYWQTLEKLNSLGYTLAWVLLCFPGLRAISSFAGCLRRGDYAGAAGVLIADILFLIGFYFLIGAF